MSRKVPCKTELQTFLMHQNQRMRIEEFNSLFEAVWWQIQNNAIHRKTIRGKFFPKRLAGVEGMLLQAQAFFDDPRFRSLSEEALAAELWEPREQPA